MLSVVAFFSACILSFNSWTIFSALFLPSSAFLQETGCLAPPPTEKWSWILNNLTVLSVLKHLHAFLHSQHCVTLNFYIIDAACIKNATCHVNLTSLILSLHITNHPSSLCGISSSFLFLLRLAVRTRQETLASPKKTTSGVPKIISQAQVFPEFAQPKPSPHLGQIAPEGVRVLRGTTWASWSISVHFCGFGPLNQLSFFWVNLKDRSHTS